VTMIPVKLLWTCDLRNGIVITFSAWDIDVTMLEPGIEHCDDFNVVLVMGTKADREGTFINITTGQLLASDSSPLRIAYIITFNRSPKPLSDTLKGHGRVNLEHALFAMYRSSCRRRKRWFHGAYHAPTYEAAATQRTSGVLPEGYTVSRAAVAHLSAKLLGSKSF
jgi:hypothetical protein